MKNILLFFCCLLLPFSALADNAQKISELQETLTWINAERHRQRENAEDLYRQYSNGEIGNEEIRERFDKIELEILRLNGKKTYLEKEIAKLKASSAQEATPSEKREDFSRRPPTPPGLLSGLWESTKTFAMWAIGILILISFIGAATEGVRTSATTVAPGPPLSNDFGIHRNRVSQNPSSFDQGRRQNRNPPSKHSGEIPPDLL